VQPVGCAEPKEIPKAAKRRTAARSTASTSKRPKAKAAGAADKGTGVGIRSGTKQSKAVEMLRSPGGATIAALTKATGWQPHSVRGFLAGVVRKRLKLGLDSAIVDGVRVYRIMRKPGAAPMDAKPAGRKS